MERIKTKLNAGRRYLFKPPTKSIEFFNGIALSLFGMVIMFNGGPIIETKFYAVFHYEIPTWIWSFVLLLGIIQLAVMRRDTLDSNVLSAIILKVSALTWFLIAIMFGSDYPPLTTSFFTYMSICLINVLAAYELSERNALGMLIREDTRDD